MTRNRTFIVLTLVVASAVGGYAWYAHSRPPAPSAVAKVLAERPQVPRAQEGQTSKSTLPKAEPAVSASSDTISLDSVQTIKEGTVISGMTSEPVLAYRLKGRQSGLIANGEISVPGSGMRKFSTVIRLTRPAQAGDTGSLDITGGSNHLITEVAL